MLVIGYGNTLRGDDGAGVRAAEHVAVRHPEVRCVCLHQLVPELAEQIADCETVFFIDAQENISQSSARLITPGQEADQPRTHFLSPESLLTLSLQLYRHIPFKAYVIGIPASQFEFSEELSAETNRAMQECVEMVDRLILDVSMENR